MAMARTAGQKQYSGRSGASATFDTEKQRKKNEEMQKRKFRPAPKEMACGGKAHKKMSTGGSTMKEVPANNAGLKKLPTEVRNKMGFKKSGGAVKQMRAGGKCAVDGIAMRGKTKIKGKR